MLLKLKMQASVSLGVLRLTLVCILTNKLFSSFINIFINVRVSLKAVVLFLEEPVDTELHTGFTVGPLLRSCSKTTTTTTTPMCDLFPADLSVAASPGPGYLSPEPLSRDACLGSSPP